MSRSVHPTKLIWSQLSTVTIEVVEPTTMVVLLQPRIEVNLAFARM